MSTANDQKTKNTNKTKKEFKLTPKMAPLVKKSQGVEKSVKEVVSKIDLNNITSQKQIGDAVLLLKMSTLISAHNESIPGSRVEVVNTSTDIGKKLLDLIHTIDEKSNSIAMRITQIVKANNFAGAQQSMDQHNKFFNDFRKLTNAFVDSYSEAAKSSNYKESDLLNYFLDQIPVQQIEEFLETKKTPQDVEPDKKEETQKNDIKTCTISKALAMLDLKSESHFTKTYIDTKKIKLDENNNCILADVEKIKEERNGGTKGTVEEV